MSEILVPISLFAMIAAIVLVPRYLRSRERQAMLDAVRAAHQSGQPVPPELIDAMTRDVKVQIQPSPMKDIRTGLILLAVGGGIAAMGYAVAMEAREAYWPMIGAACIPGFIGLALLVFGVIGQVSKKR